MLEVSTPILSALLSTTRRAVPSAPNQPIFANVLLDARDGILTAICTDGTVWIRQTAAVDTPEPSRMAVKASLIADIAGKVTANAITLTPSENGVAVNAGRSKYNLPTLPPDQYPPFPDVSGWPVVAQCESGALRLALNRALTHAAKDERAWASAALLYSVNGEVMVVGTYQGAGAITALDKAEDFPPLAVPNGPAKLIETSLPTGDSPVLVSLSGGRIAFSTGSLIIVAPLRDEALPGWDSNIAPAIREDDASQAHYLPTKELADALSRLLITMPDPFAQSVRVALGDSTALLSSEGQDGSGSEVVPCEGTNTMEANFHAGRLLRCVQAIKGDKLRVGTVKGSIKITDPRAPESMQLLAKLTGRGNG